MLINKHVLTDTDGSAVALANLDETVLEIEMQPVVGLTLQVRGHP